MRHAALASLAARAGLVALAACAGGGSAPPPPPEEPEVPRAAVELLVKRRSRSGERSFYTMAPDGSRVAPFTGVPADALEVVPAPDGRALALLRLAPEGDVHLWLSDRRGGGARPVLEGTRVVESVAWSPDGERIAFGQSSLTASDDIWVARRDGSGAVNLTPDPAVLSAGAVHLYRGGPGGPGVAASHGFTGDGRALALSDLDDDGALEILAVHARDGDLFRTAAFAWSDAGGLVWYLDHASPFGGARRACAGDATGEGAPDLAVLSAAGGEVLLVPGQGDGTFGAAARAGAGLADVAEALPLCADLDGDRRADLAVLRPGAGLAVLSATGAGFSAPAALEVRGSALVAADLDRDGDVDLAVAGSGPEVRFLRNRGDGRLARPVAFPAGGSPLHLAAVDLDGDGWVDLVAADADGSVVVLRNLGAGG